MWKRLTSVRAVAMIPLGKCRFECICTLAKRPGKNKDWLNRASSSSSAYDSKKPCTKSVFLSQMLESNRIC